MNDKEKLIEKSNLQQELQMIVGMTIEKIAELEDKIKKLTERISKLEMEKQNGKN